MLRLELHWIRSRQEPYRGSTTLTLTLTLTLALTLALALTLTLTLTLTLSRKRNARPRSATSGGATYQESHRSSSTTRRVRSLRCRAR